MGWEKRNEYVLNQNVMNMSYNVDDNRLSTDQSNITVNFATTPATITIKQGSLIEVNGNNYALNTSDDTFQMANATDNYITITDSPALVFSSAPTKGTFDSQKQGYYQAGNTTRTLKWYIDQTREIFRCIISMNEPYLLTTDETDHFDHCAVTFASNKVMTNATAKLNFETVVHDTKGLFNLSTDQYTISEDGYYEVSFHTDFTTTYAGDFWVHHAIRVGANAILNNYFYLATAISRLGPSTQDMSRKVFLNKGDVLSVYRVASTGVTITLLAGSSHSVFCIDRLF